MHRPKQDVEHRIENLKAQLKDPLERETAAFARIEAPESAQSGAHNAPLGPLSSIKE